MANLFVAAVAYCKSLGITIPDPQIGDSELVWASFMKRNGTELSYVRFPTSSYLDYTLYNVVFFDCDHVNHVHHVHHVNISENDLSIVLPHLCYPTPGNTNRLSPEFNPNVNPAYSSFLRKRPSKQSQHNSQKHRSKYSL
jgi:hypothetical protein